MLQVRGGKEKEIIAEIQDILEKTNSKKKVADLWFLPQGKEGKNLIPRYIFCHCILDEELVKLIYNVPGVFSFLNHTKDEKKSPEPLSPQKTVELLDLFQKAKRGELDKQKKDESCFQHGDRIKVTQGAYTDCQGEIIEIEPEKKLITINVNFLGQLTPISVRTEDCIKEIK